MNRIIKKIKGLVRRAVRQYNTLGGGNNIRGVSWSRRLGNFVIAGTNNTVDIRSRLPKEVRIAVFGNNHRLVVEDGVVFKSGQIWFEDYDCEMVIGSGTTIEAAELAVAENGTKLTIGRDCMFSRGIRISTTDSHSILSVETECRINPARDIEIKDHVWLGYNVTINKGVTVGENSVVAGNSVVTKPVPSNSIVAGVPARVVKTGIFWSRQRV